MADNMTSAEARVIEATQEHMRADMQRMGEALQGVQTTMALLPEIRAILQAMKDDMARGATRMDKHEERLSNVERDMPGLRELRKWVVGGVLAGVGMMGTALAKLVILDVPRIPQPYIVQQDQRAKAQPQVPRIEGP